MGDKRELETTQDLFGKLPKLMSDDQRQEFLEALDAYVKVRINAAVKDLDDKINQRGEYDPDY